jgi:uncharacterized protein YjfI (DUF2170 family)
MLLQIICIVFGPGSTSVICKESLRKLVVESLMTPHGTFDLKEGSNLTVEKKCLLSVTDIGWQSNEQENCKKLFDNLNKASTTHTIYCILYCRAFHSGVTT